MVTASDSHEGDGDLIAPDAPTSTPEAQPSLKWKVRVGEGRPDRVIVVLAVALIAGGLGLKIGGHPLFAVIGFAMILASTTEVWWGTRYELNATGAKATTGVSTTSIEWKDVKRVLRKSSELTLSPLATESRLSPFRGVTLRYGSLGSEAVWAAVQQWGGEHVRELG
jgi:hypothetical protein